MSDGLPALVRFGRELRAAGLRVGTDRLVELSRAAALLEPRDFYWAGRTTLLAGPDEIPVYDRIFAEVFGSHPPPRRGQTVAVSVEAELAPAGEAGIASPDELLREKRFDRCSEPELAALARLARSSPLTPPSRRSRRLAPARRGALDLRRTLRLALRAGGEPLKRPQRARRARPRRLVLLIDVSASMSASARPLLLLAHATLRANPRSEVFSFGTRLTRLTPALALARSDEALARAAELALDRDAGTRIGEALKRFLDDYGHRGLARGALVVICSDGLETGDPALLGEQAARLARLAHRVVWLNPLKADPAYEPLARGMRAALPHVNVFTSGHNLRNLEALADALTRDTTWHSPGLGRARAPGPPRV